MPSGEFHAHPGKQQSQHRNVPGPGGPRPRHPGRRAGAIRRIPDASGVHLNDENGSKSGPQDKRCQIEARLKHHEPLSVTHKAESLDLAIDGAAEKMLHALDHLTGKLSR